MYIYIITRRHVGVESACLFSFPYDLISSLKLYAYSVYTSVYTYRTALYRWRVRRKVTRNKIIYYYVIVLPPPPPSTPTKSYLPIWYITIGITFEYNNNNIRTHTHTHSYYIRTRSLVDKQSLEYVNHTRHSDSRVFEFHLGN